VDAPLDEHGSRVRCWLGASFHYLASAKRCLRDTVLKPAFATTRAVLAPNLLLCVQRATVLTST
jgi:hypothetical protein